jgi:hypothetical protein
MADLVTRLKDLATRIATEVKSVRTLVNGNAADLSGLSTTAKTNLVAAVNEVSAAVAQANAGTAALISDTTSGATKTWSSQKIGLEIAAQTKAVKDQLTNGASAALDTLSELAAALGNDANFAATTSAALASRVRFDAAQTLTAAQKTQAGANIGIGEPDTDFVAVFTAALA